MTGVFISMEGPEGSGKSTHAARLAAGLRDSGRDVVSVREPGGTATGEAIRAILQHDGAGEPLFPETETLLFVACRAQLVRQVIRPALLRGACVIADRFADSTMAYQGYGRGFGAEHIAPLNEFAVRDTRPDLTLLLDLSVKEGLARIHARTCNTGAALDRLEQESIAFHEDVRRGYLRIAKQAPERVRLIRADQPVETVARYIRSEVEHLLLQRATAESRDETHGEKA